MVGYLRQSGQLGLTFLPLIHNISRRPKGVGSSGYIWAPEEILSIWSRAKGSFLVSYT